MVLGDCGYNHDKYRRLVGNLGVSPLIVSRDTEHGSCLNTQRWVKSGQSPLLEAGGVFDTSYLPVAGDEIVADGEGVRVLPPEDALGIGKDLLFEVDGFLKPFYLPVERWRGCCGRRGS
ncbi:hypothetical protein NBG84_00060 [Streptomyces sp. CWNU-1]|uniref:Uncharacterized protein n=1 Tax=Streptomyces albipurpureus TaxID=2897419 RepID=A0ABT0UF45_9ACTN|nr:hypothetical protein [Streptomyces sp. CWNU-1]MCM2386721.1 hypothetical protein [Streptomyces sp. CWNU-1]